MTKTITAAMLAVFMLFGLPACSFREPVAFASDSLSISANLESAAGRLVRMTAGEVEVVITLNDSQATADFVKMLPLELTLIERNGFAKGMTLPRALSTHEVTTREYEIGDFGYWAAGPDLAIFYDHIYDQTIVPVLPMGRVEKGAETMRDTSGTVRLELVPEQENGGRAE